MSHYLVLDQGGHGSRAFVYAADGAVVAAAHRPVATQRSPGRVEQDPEALVASLRACVAEVAAAVPAGTIAAAGLACQRASVVCWDKTDGTALTPVISWQDTRAAPLFDRLALDPARVSAITGLPPSAHYGASKLAWCLQHTPDHGRLAIGPLAAFLLFRLLETSPLRVSRTLAQRTLLYDLDARDWSDELLSAFGIARGLLPECVPDCSEHGELAVGDARVPVTVCAGDQNAVPFAFGAPRADTLYLNLGTGAFLLRPIARRALAPRGLLQTPLEAADGAARWAAEGTVNGAGAALTWYGERRGGRPMPWAALEALPVTARLPLFVNGIGGVGSPFWRTGVAPRFEPAAPAFVDGAYAVLESIVFLIRANVERLAPVQRVIVAGGLSNSALLRRLLAAALRLPVARALDDDATSRGVCALVNPAAPAGATAAGGGASDDGLAALLDERYSRWRSLF